MIRTANWALALSGIMGVVVAALFATSAAAQSVSETQPRPPGMRGSPNVHVLSHIPLGAYLTVTDIEMEQELSRPYVYVSRRNCRIDHLNCGMSQDKGFDLINIEDPDNAEVIYKWRIENQELHQGGAMDSKQFKIDDRYYFIQSVSFRQGGPNSDVGGIVFDVTDLPDVSRIREVGRVRPEGGGGFHNIFVYKHSDGRVILFATHRRLAKMFDMGRFVAGEEDQGYLGGVPVPPTPGALSEGYHDFYVAFDPATQRDVFYGGGGGGYYLFDVTQPEEPELITTVTGVSGINWGHTVTPTPDGRYVIGETEFQYQPLRIFDLKPGLDAAARGEVANINRSIGAWQADWKTLAHNHEVRWPYVFVAGYETGLSVFNMMDPTNPYTVGYYDTYPGPHNTRPGPANSSYTWGVYQGAWGVDVRNADGLIVISDGVTGFWLMKMDGFEGWNGYDWGMPNNSSAQDWDNGPDGVQRPIS